MAGQGDHQDDLNVSIRWPKGYDDDDVKSPFRRRRKAAVDEPRRPGGPRDQPTDLDVGSEAAPLLFPDAAPAGGDPDLGARVDRISDNLTMVTKQITEALTASDKAVRRVERLCSALSVEVAEVGQSISDQVAQVSSATTEKGTGKTTASTKAMGTSAATSAALTSISRKLDGLAASVADASDRPAVTSTDGLEEVVEGTADAVTRIETLVEALIEASDARPTDISEQSARTLERLGLTVGARFEANTTNAVEAIDTSINEAIERAVSQFKEMAPPVVDRSTTAAVTRLEERVAALTRQRDEHDRETKATLNGLEETVGRLASAQAEDLERILDTIEAAAPPTPPPERPDVIRLARIEASIADLAKEPTGSKHSVDTVAQQLAAVSKQLEALRRRLPLRGRAAAAGLDERSLSVLAALVAEHLQASAAPTAAPRRAPRTARTPRPPLPAARPATAARPAREAASTGAPRSARRRLTDE
ncbi:MAG: hypothetical protein ACR2MN_03915 [Acidimicrobiales bacterium]